ncbi:MAG: Nif3-like dinuclear metal center hexameric protein [Deinococcus-Thermus bacterium]|jgi:dinuclear metal center YbgI/SA1388 family protein|nr:Nif3-like dinuclear metal center hexameric protein [Deinococcota bacterium]
MKRDDLVRWLDDTLSVRDFEDPSLNGLQVEGTADVAKVAVAVDATYAAFEQAAEVGADMLIVHHGLFWGGAEPLRGMLGRRVRYLIERDINLYAAHIPLDAHRELGNNWGLARILGMDELAPFGSWKGTPIGVKGIFPTPLSLRDLADTIEKELGESVLVHAGGAMEVGSLGIISGAAARDVATAADEGLDAFLTGEPKHDVFAVPFERGINALFAGHYMTETVGVNLLKDRLREEFDVTTEFLLLPTGL